MVSIFYAEGKNLHFFFFLMERYPVPQRRATQGWSEKYLGRWMRERKIPRDRVVVATKVLSCFPFILLCFSFCFMSGLDGDDLCGCLY